MPDYNSLRDQFFGRVQLDPRLAEDHMPYRWQTIDLAKERGRLYDTGAPLEDAYMPRPMMSRGEMFMRQMAHNSSVADPSLVPTYGFKPVENTNPWGPVFDQLIQIMNDPRNSWIGLGPMMGAFKIMHPKFGNYFVKTADEARALIKKLRQQAEDAGIYNVHPTVHEIPDEVLSPSPMKQEAAKAGGDIAEKGSQQQIVRFGNEKPSLDSRPGSGPVPYPDWLWMRGGYRPETGAKHAARTADGSYTGGTSESPESWAQMLLDRWNQFRTQHAEVVGEGELTPEQALEAMKRMNLVPPGYDETMRTRIPPQGSGN